MNGKIITIVTLLASLTLTAGPAHAVDKYKVSKMVYFNQGGYTACLKLFWKSQETGKKGWMHATIGEKWCIAKRDSFSINLEHYATFKDGKKTRFSEGDEMWLRVYIDLGDDENCRKDGAKYYYYTGGGTIKYKTKGTTLKNNRCQIKSKPDSSYLF